MKIVIDWVKANPLIVTAASVSFIGILVIVYFLFMSAPDFREEKAKTVQQVKTKQDTLLRVSVPLPNEDPNAAPVPQNVVINGQVIEQVKNIYGEIASQYSNILQLTEDKNAKSHRGFLLGGNQIWPDADPKTSFSLYVTAKADYLAHFKALFDYKNESETNWNMARMVASGPPSATELQLKLQESAINFMRSNGATTTSGLTQDQAEQLFAQQRMVLMNLLTDRARSIHIYAKLRPEDVNPFAPKEAPAEGTGVVASPVSGLGFGRGNSNAEQSDYPFDIAAWAQAEGQPRPDQLWEGQVQLWILRDIMEAISSVNNVGKKIDVMAPNGSIEREPASVINSPIKRLISLKTLQGYVGLHNTGALATDISTSSSSTGSAIGSTEPSVYPEPIEGLVPTKPSEKAPEHFGITPTGRISNSVFDVRHSKLVIDIEGNKIPELMQRLREINFMTVIRITTTDVDEYEVLKEGYVYGKGDVVRAEILIESLWFRNWTEGLMPKSVKSKMLFELPEDQAANQ